MVDSTQALVEEPKKSDIRSDVVSGHSSTKPRPQTEIGFNREKHLPPRFTASGKEIPPHPYETMDENILASDVKRPLTLIMTTHHTE